MRIIFGIMITVSIYGVILYWNTDKLKRNVSILVSIVLVMTFNLLIREENPTEESDPIDYEKVVENPSYDYKIVDREVKELKDSVIGDFSAYFIYAVTEEQLNKNQIEELLHKIKEENEDEKTIEDLYILLYENEIIAGRAYSLGRLADLEEGLEVNARQKDWVEQPSRKEYEIYQEFIEAAEAEESLKTEEELAKEMSKERGLEAKEVLTIVQKVEDFIAMDESTNK